MGDGPQEDDVDGKLMRHLPMLLIKSTRANANLRQMGDVVFERQPQSRWRDEYKDEAKQTMDAMKLGERQKD